MNITPGMIREKDALIQFLQTRNGQLSDAIDNLAKELSIERQRVQQLEQPNLEGIENAETLPTL